MPLTAFVARSFDPKDEERIRPILNFLESFRKAGFLCDEAAAAEVESVSKKVREMIDERQVFVGFFTRKYPVYGTSKEISRFSIFGGTPKPQIWSAPSWVLQESGYAIGARKKLILLREDGVEIPGLQGDLEYVPFESASPAIVFSKLSEMINDLLAKEAGREVTEVVVERQQEMKVAIEPVAPEPRSETPEGSEPPDIIIHLIDMTEASEKGDLSTLYNAYAKGKELISEGKSKVDQLAWSCHYFEQRFKAGAPDGLDSLRRLRSENSNRTEPTVAIARLLYHSKECAESARLFVEASNLADGDEKADYLIKAGQAYRDLKQYEEAKSAVGEALAIATGETRWEAVSIFYQLLKLSGEKYLAFATAESALHQNPQLPLRFTLALDYRRDDLNGLALYHFKWLGDQHQGDSSALHNLALLYSDCKLPILSVENYKTALALGETLSAANLGFMYLDAGMTEQARTLVREAMQIEPHDGRVEACLAEIVQRPKDEAREEADLLDAAANEKEFLVTMGLALLRPVPRVDGLWTFPFGEMALRSSLKTVNGTADVARRATPPGLSALYGIVESKGSKEPIKTDRYTLTGKMEGAVCRFELSITNDSPPGWLGAVSSVLSGPNSRSGLIVFASDDKSATYAEIADDNIGKREELTKVHGQ